MLLSKPVTLLATMLFGRSAMAAALAAPAPLITPGPQLADRDILNILGYYSRGTTGGTVIWGSITQNDISATLTSSASLYRICGATSSCPFFTCSGNYVVYPMTDSASSPISLLCGTTSGAVSRCNSDVLLTDVSDTTPMTSYWCGTRSGYVIYEKTPNGLLTSGASVTLSTPITPSATDSASPAPVPSSISAASSAVSASSVTGVGPETASATAVATTSSKSTPIGPIVGGVIGGLAVLGAIIVGIIFLMRRKRNSTPPPPPSSAVQQYPQYHQQSPQVQQMAPAQYYNPAQAYPPPEKTPNVAGMQVNPYYADNGFGGGPASPVPQYAPTPYQGATEINELPAQRH